MAKPLYAIPVQSALQLTFRVYLPFYIFRSGLIWHFCVILGGASTEDSMRDL